MSNVHVKRLMCIYIILKNKKWIQYDLQRLNAKKP